MKILVVHTFYFPVIMGGAEYSLKKFCEGMQSKGHEVFILCDTDKNEITEDINGVRVYRRRTKCIRQSKTPVKKILRALLELKNPFNKKMVKNIIKEVNPDLIYTNCLERFSPIVWDVATKIGIPIVDTQRVYSLLDPASGKYKFGIKFWKKKNRKNSSKVDYEISISKYTKNLFINEGFFPNARHHVIYNSIDYDKVLLSSLIDNKKENLDRIFKFVFIGTYKEHKGVLWLIESFKKLDINAELYFYGAGPLKEQMVDMSNEKIFVGDWLDENELGKNLIDKDILVAPSIWEEPFGRVVLDAYKYGLPVIVANSGGLIETVDRNTGIIVEKNNEEQMMEAIKRFVINKAFYKKCLDYIPDKILDFGLENYLNKFDCIFNEIIKENVDND